MTITIANHFINHVPGTHLTCNKQFDGYGGEVAHKFFRDVHFDKTEPYSASNEASMNTISLTLVSLLQRMFTCMCVYLHVYRFPAPTSSECDLTIIKRKQPAINHFDPINKICCFKLKMKRIFKNTNQN